MSEFCLPEWRIWTPTTEAPIHTDPFDHFKKSSRMIGLVATQIESLGVINNGDNEQNRQLKIGFRGKVDNLGTVFFQGPFDTRLIEAYKLLTRGRIDFGCPSTAEQLAEKLRSGGFLGTNIHLIGGEGDNPLRPDLYFFSTLGNR